MDRRFLEELKIVESACGKLREMEPRTRELLSRHVPEAGIYMFSEGNENLYVGRTDRMRDRILEHGRQSSRHNVAAFAFRLAREATGKVNATYQAAGSRAHLEEDPAFQQAFLAAKERVREMRIRWVEEQDPIRQALLEIYAAVTLNARYNRFQNT